VIKRILACALVVGGCASTPATNDKVEIPAASQLTTQRCEDLPQPKIALEHMTMGELMVYNAELMVLYVECALKHDHLVKEAGGKIKLSK
jgi:PBP1b-binding outer membrane lipoprotein LpoB